MPLRLARNERKLLEAMETHSTVKEAAIAAGIDPKNAGQICYRIRAKGDNAVKFLNELKARSKRSKLINKILTSRKE